MSLDPSGASRLSATDLPRLLRVIERAQQRALPHSLAPSEHFLKIGLQRPRSELYARINARSMVLWPALLEEAAGMIARGGAISALADRTIGYREAAQALRGALKQEEAIALLQRNTRRLAKRQLTWWRRETNTIWVRPDEGLAQLSPSLQMLLAH